MPPDRFLQDTAADEAPSVDQTQQLIEAEHGRGSQGINRRWLASDSAAVVLTSTTAGVRISPDNGATAPANLIVQGSPAGGNLSGTYPNPTVSAATIDALLPPGLIMAWAATSPAFPAGWLPCNGSVVLRSSYPKLFAAIGTTWNTGGEDGTNFRLPNLQGRVLVGSGGVYPFAQLAGQASVPGPGHTHTGSHSHGLNSHTHGLNSHTHGLNNHTHPPGTHIHAAPTHEHTILHGHDLSSHTHTTDLDHNHALAAGVAVASGAITGVHEGPSAVVNVSANGHAHDVDLPALGLLNKTSAVSNPNVTGAMPATSSGTNAAANTGGPSAADTGGNTGDTTGNAGATTGATGATATDSTAPAASYTETIATLPPYAVAQYIIRTG